MKGFACSWSLAYLGPLPAIQDEEAVICSFGVRPLSIPKRFPHWGTAGATNPEGHKGEGVLF